MTKFKIQQFEVSPDCSSTYKIQTGTVLIIFQLFCERANLFSIIEINLE